MPGLQLCRGTFYGQSYFLCLPPRKVPAIPETPQTPCLVSLGAEQPCLSHAEGNGCSLLSLQQELPCVLQVRELLKCIKRWRSAWPFLGMQTCTDTEPLKPCECGHVGLRAGSGGVLNISAWYGTASGPPAPLPKSPSRGPRLQSPQHLKQHWREIQGTLASPYLSHEQTV